MHQFEHGKTTFNFNSDLTGEIVVHTRERDGFRSSIVHVPGDDLRAFMTFILENTVGGIFCPPEEDHEN